MLACEQALWSGKARRKTERTSKETWRGWGRKEGEREGQPRPLPQPTLGLLRSLIYFRAFSQLRSLFTGYENAHTSLQTRV